MDVDENVMPDGGNQDQQAERQEHLTALFREAIEKVVNDVVDEDFRRERLYYTISNNNNRSKRLLSDPASECKQFVMASTPAADDGVALIQIAVHPQQSSFLYGAACGYYSAHNALTAIAACCAANVATTHEWLLEAQSPSAFLRFTNQARNLFLERAERSRHGDDKSQLWNAEHILDSFEVHRAHMQYLIQALPVFHALGGADAVTALPSISQLEMKNGIMTVAECDKLQRVLGAFTRKQTHCHGLVIGTGTHWLSLIVNKVQGHTEIIILESYNTPLLNTTDEELFAYVERTLQGHIPEYTRRLQNKKGFRVGYSEAQLRKIVIEGHGRNEWDPMHVYSLQEKADSWFRSLCDARYTLKLVQDVITGKRTARQCYMATVVDGLCELFSARKSKIDYVLAKIEGKQETPQGPAPANNNSNKNEEEEEANAAHVPPQLTLQRQVSFVPIELWLNDPHAFFLPTEIHCNVLNGIMSDLGAENLGVEAAFQLQTWTTRTRTLLASYRERLYKTSRDNSVEDPVTTGRSVEYQRNVVKQMGNLLDSLDVFANKAYC